MTCGSDAPLPPVPSQCSGSGCQGVPASPPVFATPSSVTYSGVGNFPPASQATAKVKQPKSKKKPKTKKHKKPAKGKRNKGGRKVKKSARKFVKSHGRSK